MTLAFLAGYRPAICAAGPDATRPRPGDGATAPDGPEPYCTSCGARVGIFLGHGMDWRHFREPGNPGATAEVYEAGHPPATGWRVVTGPAQGARA